MVIALSVLAGFDESLHSLAESFTSHIQVRSDAAASLGEKEALYRSLPTLTQGIRQVDAVISINALVYAHGTTEGVSIKSVPQSLFADAEFAVITGNRHRVVAGSTDLAAMADRSVAIGGRLASRLGCGAGDTVLITTTSSDSRMFSPFDVQPVCVAAVYESGMTQYDDIYLFAPYAFCRTIIDTIHAGALSAEVWVDDRRSVGRIASELAERSRFSLECTTVDDLHRGMFSWIEIQKRPVPLVIALISIVAVFNVVTTLLISIVEKTRSYAILQTLGLSGREVIALVCWQGFRLGFAGSAAGSLAAFICLYLQKTYALVRLDGAIYFIDRVPVVLDPFHPLLVIGVASGISVLATFIPGIIASRFSPVANLRFR
ncbi:MAG: ABC transporter permease [Candidatus Kapaibacterium sp.]